jgi:hypothetical protein
LPHWSGSVLIAGFVNAAGRLARLEQLRIPRDWIIVLG